MKCAYFRVSGSGTFICIECAMCLCALLCRECLHNYAIL